MPKRRIPKSQRKSVSEVNINDLPPRWRKRFIDTLVNGMLQSLANRDRIKPPNPYRKAEEKKRLQADNDFLKKQVSVLERMLSGRSVFGHAPPEVEDGVVYVTPETTKPHRVGILSKLWSLPQDRTIVTLESDTEDWEAGRVGHLEVRPGIDIQIRLPDGATLDVQKNGSFVLNRPDHPKPFYGPPDVRPFNPYVNASDQLANLIGDLARIGVPQDLLLKMPVEVFINWLIYEATIQDDGDVEGLPVPEDHPWVSQFLPDALAAPAEPEGDPADAKAITGPTS